MPIEVPHREIWRCRDSNISLWTSFWHHILSFIVHYFSLCYCSSKFTIHTTFNSDWNGCPCEFSSLFFIEHRLQYNFTSNEQYGPRTYLICDRQRLHGRSSSNGSAAVPCWIWEGDKTGEGRLFHLIHHNNHRCIGNRNHLLDWERKPFLEQ